MSFGARPERAALAGRRRGGRPLRPRRRLRAADAESAHGRRPGSVGGGDLGRPHARRSARSARPRRSLHLPFEVADYVDFYSSLEHATNLGRLFRPDQEPLLPNWRWLPGRVPRPRRKRRRQRHGRRAAARAAQGAGRGRADLRPEPPPRLRARARLRRRHADEARRARARRSVRGSRLRRRARQRLERARHPGVGVRAARPEPRQVVPDLGLGLGDAARAARGSAGRGARAGSRRRCRISPAAATGGSTSRSRWS